MNDIVFRAEEVLPLLAHSEAADKWRSIYGVEETAAPGLWFVHDEGVYLMSNADPGLLRLDCPEGETHYQAAYALGMSPEDEDWFDTAGDAVGYDDFGEWLPASMFAQAKTEVYDGIRISLTKKAIRVWCVPLRNYEQQGE